MRPFIVYNGQVLPGDKFDLTPTLWKSPVPIVHQLWFGHGTIPLFFENLELLKQQLKILNYTVPEFLFQPRELFRITKRMLNKNKYYRSGILEVLLYPDEQTFDYLIKAHAREEFDFPILQPGTLLGVSEQKKTLEGNPAHYPLFNRSLWELAAAGLHAKTESNAVILNTSLQICEAIASNVFLIKDKKIITPATNTGCYQDPIKLPIARAAISAGLDYLEVPVIKPEILPEMDEIFLASERKGIEVIMGIGQRRFIHEKTVHLHEHLNEWLKKKEPY